MDGIFLVTMGAYGPISMETTMVKDLQAGIQIKCRVAVIPRGKMCSLFQKKKTGSCHLVSKITGRRYRAMAQKSTMAHIKK